MKDFTPAEKFGWRLSAVARRTDIRAKVGLLCHGQEIAL